MTRITLDKGYVQVAKLKNLSIAAINITIQPHSPQKYISLFKAAEDTKKAIRVSGDVYLQLVRGIFHIDINNPENGIYGDIAKYVDIPPDTKWLNLDTEAEAEENDLKAVSIPENMKPNYNPFAFVFYPKTHQFFYESRNGNYRLSPKYVEKLLRGVFQLPEIEKRFGKVDVTVIPQDDTVEQILSIHKLTTLSLRLTRPNPDDFGDDEEILEILDSQNIGVQDVVNKAVKGRTIKPSSVTKKLARVASRNGYVEGSGYDNEGNPVSDSTKSHPFTLGYAYQPEKQLLIDALQAAAAKAMKILNK